MTNVFASVGVMLITVKCFFWLSILANTAFFLAFLVGLILFRNDDSQLTSSECKVLHQEEI